MYLADSLDGASLPEKVLCLTYDDGPGEDSEKLAEFLKGEGVQATFFVVGKFAVHHEETLGRIASLGHLIGNHTWDHPDMPYYLSVDGDLPCQVLRTDAILKKFNPGRKIYFRSPYGKWSPEVARELNLNLSACLDHVGPIHWDVIGIDCHCWKNGLSVEDTAAMYLKDIDRKGRGIVVMHDGTADMEYLKGKNRTLELTRQLVPLLKSRGYSFVRLDEIDSIRNEAARTLAFDLKTRAGNFVSLGSNFDFLITTDSQNSSSLSRLTVQDMGHGKVAFTASNGLFLSLCHDKNNSIEASGRALSDHEMFDLIPLSSNEIMLRAFNGNYLCQENKHGGRLVAGAEFMRGAGRFSFIPSGAEAEKTRTLREKYRSLKRQFLYVKSKIEQNTK